MALRNGDSFTAVDVRPENHLSGAQVATYCNSVREGGRANGRALGVLAIHVDWEPQARTIVSGVRVSPEDRDRTRVMLVDANLRVLCASDGRGALTGKLPNDFGTQTSGVVQDGRNRRVTAFHRTPGYETYRRLGWYGIIIQNRE